MVVKPQAVSIQACAVGEASIVRRYIIYGRSVRAGDRVGIQVRLDCRFCTLARRNGRNGCLFNLRQAQSQAFVGKKEKRAILYNRAAECSSKVVLPFFW